MEKEYAKGIYIKKFTGEYGDWLSVAIKDGDNYKYYNFYPKKEQKNTQYIDYYGVVSNWKPEKKDDKNIVKFNEPNDEEIPF